MKITNPQQGVLDKFKELEDANVEIVRLHDLNEKLGKENEKLAGKLEKATKKIAELKKKATKTTK